jgi:tRNA uridine 5-carbamoylmethylation protein Kti12
MKRSSGDAKQNINKDGITSAEKNLQKKIAEVEKENNEDKKEEIEKLEELRKENLQRLNKTQTESKELGEEKKKMLIETLGKAPGTSPKPVAAERKLLPHALMPGDVR